MTRLLALALSAVALAGHSGTSARPHGYRILLTSNRDGRVRGYSVRPDGSRLTPLLAPTSTLVPAAVSRDGTTVAYDADSGIVVSRANGTRLRHVVAEPAGGAALSPDGRLLAFTRKTLGIWVVGTDGRGARRLTRRADSMPTWSPDGKKLAFIHSVSDDAETLVVRPLRGRARMLTRGRFAQLAWSPDGKWIAYSLATYRNDGLWVVRPNGTDRHRVAGDVFDTFSWSPDGTKLAFPSGDGGAVGVVGPDSRLRWLPLPRLGVANLAWLPDGRLALQAFDGQLWVVRLDGRGLQRVLSAARNAILGWTRLAPARPPAPTPPTTERVVDRRTLALRAPVSSFAADGARVAFVTGETPADCVHVAVWTPAARTVARPSPSPCEDSPYVLDGVALAGTSVAWGFHSTGHTTDSEVAAAKLPRLDPPFRDVADATVSDEGGNRLGDPVGDGTLLAFTVQFHCYTVWGEPDGANACPPGYENGDVSSATLVRLGGNGACPSSGDSEVGGCLVLKVDGRLDLLAVDAGRIVVGTKRGVEILNAAGRVLRDVPVAAKAAALSGDRLAVQTAAGVDVYDTASGRLVTQLTGLKGLQDLDSGILVTASGSVVTLRRLADGRTTTFQVTGKARAQLESPGLFVAGARRITFTPMRELFR